MMKLLHILLVFSMFCLPFSANADTGIVGYFDSPTAAEPRPNDIITFSPGLGWHASNFTGKDLDYTNGASVSTTAVGTYSGTFVVGNYYAKGIVFCDNVHKKAVIPAGQTWPIDVYAARSSDLASTDEILEYGIFVWRGATDSLLYTVGTGPIVLSADAYTLYSASETNADDIVLAPGDRLCVEFYAHINVLINLGAITKWAISIRYNHSTYPSKLTYPQFKEEIYKLNPLLQ